MAVRASLLSFLSNLYFLFSDQNRPVTPLAVSSTDAPPCAPPDRLARRWPNGRAAVHLHSDALAGLLAGAACALARGSVEEIRRGVSSWRRRHGRREHKRCSPPWFAFQGLRGRGNFVASYVWRKGAGRRRVNGDERDHGESLAAN